MSKSTPSTGSANNPSAKQPVKMLCSSTCVSAYQDERYGKGVRVFNPRKENKYACTVCGSIREK